MGFALIHLPPKGQQSTLDQQLMPIKQSHLMLAISIANNQGHFSQAFWVQVFHKT
jgi:hypothetical protein